MAEQIDPATGKPRRKRKGDRKPADPMRPMIPDAPAGQQPPAGVNEMFNPTPQPVPDLTFEQAGPAYARMGPEPEFEKLRAEFRGDIMRGHPRFEGVGPQAPLLGRAPSAIARDSAPLPEQRAVPPTPFMQDQAREQARQEREASVREFDQQRLNRNPSLTQPDMNMPPAPQQLPMSPVPRPQTLDPAGYDPLSDEIQAPAPQAPAPQAPAPQAPAPMEANPFINTMADRTVMAGQTSPQPPSIMPPEQQAIAGPQEIAGPPAPPAPEAAPAPQMRPPTNQFGQPIRGILPPERAPEDPNRVMEEFGRGSPEHIAALQDQMRTQQVAVSRPEDMADPRLAHLPTAEEYDMNLTRRRYGEEAIDKRAGELRGEARFRTEADAVRLAGREALDQRRRDRGLPDSKQRAEQREEIRGRQQQMFEERRTRERGERQARRDRQQLKRDARDAGMTPLEYQMAQEQIKKVGAEERTAARELDIQEKALAQQGGEAQRSYDLQVRTLEQQGKQFEATNLRMIQEFERTSGLKEFELETAANALKNDKAHNDTMAKIAQGELDLKGAAQAFAETQFAERGKMTKAELLTMVVQASAASQGTFTVAQLVGELAMVDPMIREMIDPTVIENADKMIGERRMSGGQVRAEETISMETPLDWIEPLGDIESDWLGLYMEPATEVTQTGYLQSMDSTMFEVHNMDDEMAVGTAKNLLARMDEAGHGRVFDAGTISLPFVSITTADDMYDIRRASYNYVAARAMGKSGEAELRSYRNEVKDLEGLRTKFDRTPSRRN